MNANKIILFLICILSLPNAFADSKKVSQKLDSSEIEQYQYCGQDSDCIVVQNGCCDCANGGEDVAISQRHEKDFKQRFDCLDIACTELAADPVCGSGTVSCINGKCRYHKP